MTASRPAGYEIAKSDVPWEKRYLDLIPPSSVHLLSELGYTDDSDALSPVGISEPFRLLSDEGVEVAVEIARELEQIAPTDKRSKRLRGCTYRSEFFAGMYADPDVLALLNDIAQADIRRHPIGHHQVQLNFAPEELTKDVDVWHYDVVSYDYVMLLTDPSEMKGGNTEYFDGTIDEGMAIVSSGEPIPDERIRAVQYPAAGWAFLQQGHRVLHRAARLEEQYPRISLVASYYCSDPKMREPTILAPLRKADGREIALVEWAGYAAHRTIERLERFLGEQPDFSRPLDEVRDDLRACLVDAEQAIAEFDSDDEGFIIGID